MLDFEFMIKFFSLRKHINDDWIFFFLAFEKKTNMTTLKNKK
jgi:hypothetical protein